MTKNWREKLKGFVGRNWRGARFTAVVMIFFAAVGVALVFWPFDADDVPKCDDQIAIIVDNPEPSGS